MIKIPINPRVTLLSNVLDKVIAEYKAPGKLMGPPNDNPKLSEADLIEIMRKGDRVVALPDVHAYYIDKLDEDKVKQFGQGLFPNSPLISLSGRFHYPPKGFMGFHTNSSAIGWRIYATRCDEDNKSFFRYYKNGKMITEWEQKGWNFRAFQIVKGSLYWHCVYTDTNRYSFGFRFQA
jgi:hypothetical protein